MKQPVRHKCDGTKNPFRVACKQCNEFAPRTKSYKKVEKLYNKLNNNNATFNSHYLSDNTSIYKFKKSKLNQQSVEDFNENT